MVRPSPYVARTTGTILLLLVALAHVLMLREGSRLAAYVGVWMVLAVGLAVACAGVLVAGHGRAGWWFALVQGALNTAGYVVTRYAGLPAVSPDPPHALWGEPDALLLLYSASLLTVLALWSLLGYSEPPPRPSESDRHPGLERRSGLAENEPSDGRGGGGGDQP